MAALEQLRWDIEFLKSGSAIREKHFGIPAEAKAVRYPIRLLRYWFGAQLLREEGERLGRPLDVAEAGVHTGQMRVFYGAYPQAAAVRRWTAFDAVVLERKLRKAGYDEIVEANLEDPGFSLGGEYDALLLLHILEHLFDPEGALRRAAEGLCPGGVVIGGFPVLPSVLAGARERRVRARAAAMGHVSVFSPRRVRAMAEGCGLRLEFAAGAFLIGVKGAASRLVSAGADLVWAGGLTAAELGRVSTAPSRLTQPWSDSMMDGCGLAPLLGCGAGSLSEPVGHIWEPEEKPWADAICFPSSLPSSRACLIEFSMEPHHDIL